MLTIERSKYFNWGSNSDKRRLRGQEFWSLIAKAIYLIFFDGENIRIHDLRSAADWHQNHKYVIYKLLQSLVKYAATWTVFIVLVIKFFAFLH